MRFFADRVDAGKKLASALRDVENGAVVLAVPRGGVVLGYEIAHALGLPLDVIITKKAGAPGNPELAIGAVAEDGAMVLDENTVRYLRVSQEYIDEEVTLPVIHRSG